MADGGTTHAPISVQALKRLPLYLNHLKTIDRDRTKIISSPAIAKALNLNEVQVRKDLAAIKCGGRPRTGYLLEKLISDLETYLGYGNVTKAILVGSGNLGRTLMLYKGFEDYGLDIVVGFDIDDTVIGTDIGSKKILHLDKMAGLCQRMHINIGVITVPATAAQDVCNGMVEVGILAIWNFAPVKLVVPEHILVQNENMASTLAVLSKHLKKKIHT